MGSIFLSGLRDQNFGKMGLRDQNNGKKIGINGSRIYYVTTLIYGGSVIVRGDKSTFCSCRNKMSYELARWTHDDVRVISSRDFL